MSRTLRITAICFGILLIALTAGVLIFRRGDATLEIVIVATRPDQQSHLQMSLAVRQGDHEIWRNVGGFYDSLDKLAVSPDGKWLYLRGVRRNALSVEISTLRVNLQNFYTERLPGIVIANTLYWTPDGVSMIYEAVDSVTGKEAIFRATPDGKNIQNLTPGLDSSVMFEPAYPPIFSPDNDWVAFNGFASENQVYITNTMTGEVKQLTSEGFPAYLRGHIRNDSGDWLIVSSVDSVYRMRVDGSELTPLLPEGEGSIVNVSFWPEANLLIIHRRQSNETLYALSMDDFSLRWTLPDFYLATTQPHQPFRMVIKGSLHPVFADGVPREPLSFLPNASDLHFSADGTMVYFAHLGPSTATSPMTGGLYNIRFADGHPQTIHTSNYSLYLLDWSSDDGWFLIATDDNPGQAIWRIWEATGRSELLASKRPFDHFLGLGHLAKPAFNGLVLWLVGGACLSGALFTMRQGAKS